MITTETKHSKKVKDRNAKIIQTWKDNFKPGETQITPLSESIAKQCKCSLSTVKRIIKDLK